MRKMIVLFAMIATLTTNGVFANVGQGAQAGTYSGSNQFAWGIGLGALAAIGTAVGVIAATASSSSSNVSH